MEFHGKDTLHSCRIAKFVVSELTREVPKSHKATKPGAAWRRCVGGNSSGRADQISFDMRHCCGDDVYRSAHGALLMAMGVFDKFDPILARLVVS